MHTMPGYWMYETGAMLRPAVRAYLAQETLDPAQIAALRAYFRQWIAAPDWRGSDIKWLREAVDHLHSRRAIRAWLARAEVAGVSPL